MRQNGYVTDRDYAVADETPLTVAKSTAQSLEAPYFVDLVNDTVQSKFGDTDLQSNALRIYTTLDLRLQRAAAEAIRLGMQSVDEQIHKQRRFRGQIVPQAQVALVAIDPHTGELKALAGGRNYGMSQLDHVLAKRQPGSIFKPFVYATAMDTAVEGGPHILTPSSMVNDEPTTFWYEHGTRDYQPSNFEHKFYGQVTLREALAHSLNVATVKVAEMVGYDNVVAMANRAGMNYRIQPTPAVALGAYEITPLEAAGAYTMFANQGVYVKPSFLTLIRSQEGKVVYRNQVEQKQVLDPRVAYLMTSMMEEVLRTGTAAGVRARYNLNFPVAGKTGTSHDGWFAGYTSELLCVVWVGFDNNEELDLEGAAFGCSHLGGVHEAGSRFPRVSRYQAFPGARWHCDCHHRSAVRHAGYRQLPEDGGGSLYRGDGAAGLLPVAWRPAAPHQRGRVGHHAARCHAARPARRTMADCRRPR